MPLVVRTFIIRSYPAQEVLESLFLSGYGVKHPTRRCVTPRETSAIKLTCLIIVILHRLGGEAHFRSRIVHAVQDSDVRHSSDRGLAMRDRDERNLTSWRRMQISIVL